MHTKTETTKDFTLIVHEATESLPRSRRIFSRFIHIKAIDYISEFISTTIARPRPLLYGGIASFVVTLSLYLLAKNFGYSLSGFESAGSFLLGWLIGLVYDLMTACFKDKSR